MALLDVFMFGARVAFWLRRALFAARSIYGRLIDGLLGATGEQALTRPATLAYSHYPVNFYDTTPIGRILNILASVSGLNLLAGQGS